MRALSIPSSSLLAVALLAAGCSNVTRVSGNGTAAPGATLDLAPKDAALDVTSGAPLPTLQYSVSVGGQAVSASWLVTPPELGTIDATGLFTASGTSGGRAIITATSGTVTATTSLTVRLHLSQNGALPGQSGGAGAGGVGGVGGEGVGGPVTAGQLTTLGGTPVKDPGQSLLYPYDGTVWPRELLAPLLQWDVGAHDPDAVALRLECPSFSWDGTFARTRTPFIRHPIPQAAWKAATDACAGQKLTLRVVFASGTTAWGPLTETWKVANGSLKGVVYYNSYGTKLASNFSGALPNGGPFGGATLAIKGSSTDPVLVAGKSGGSDQCRVCHVVASDGSTLVTQHGGDYEASSAYALKAGNAETPMSPTDGRFAWSGLSPDGTLLLSNAAPLMSATSAPSGLFAVPSGAPVAATGLPAGLRAGSPVFAHDGTAVAFNWYGGAAAGGTGDQRTLAMMRFAKPGTFSDFTPLVTPANGHTAMHPSFFPTSKGIVYEEEVESNGRSFGETRSTCDGSGACSDVGARGELWWVDVATKQAHRLDNANGKGHAPTGPEGHGDDPTLNYEPTVGPIPSGGYAWVIFTSRRLYGNVATINPYWSDPRFHDISSTPTTKKLWIAAIDLDAAPGTDPSHAAFYVPAQELLAGNSRGYWSAEACMADGEGCGSGDQCCSGYCRGPSIDAQTCVPSIGGQCANEFEKCTTAADCCNAMEGASCVNNRCVAPNVPGGGGTDGGFR